MKKVPIEFIRPHKRHKVGDIIEVRPNEARILEALNKAIPYVARKMPKADKAMVEQPVTKAPEVPPIVTPPATESAPRVGVNAPALPPIPAASKVTQLPKNTKDNSKNSNKAD